MSSDGDKPTAMNTTMTSQRGYYDVPLADVDPSSLYPSIIARNNEVKYDEAFRQRQWQRFKEFSDMAAAFNESISPKK
jgi:hypothetical protein